MKRGGGRAGTKGVEKYVCCMYIKNGETIMIRTGFYLTDRQIALLQKESKRKGLKVSEIIRRAIDQYFEKDN